MILDGNALHDLEMGKYKSVLTLLMNIPLMTVLTERIRFRSCALIPGSSPNPPILCSAPQPTEKNILKQKNASTI